MTVLTVEGINPVRGPGRCSSILRQSMETDGCPCVAGNIVETLISSPIRTAANSTFDRQVTEDLATVVEMTRNFLSLDDRI